MRFKLSVRNLFVISTFFLSLRAVVPTQTPRSGAQPRTASIGGRVTIGGQPAVNKKVLVADINTGWGSPDSGSGGGGTQGGRCFIVVTDAGGQYNQ